MSYQPIENYGIIGNLHTVALVGLDGSIDFLCFPQFDSPSVFARLLDDKNGGCFSLSPEFKEMKTKQLYLPDTNVLLTRFLSADGVGEITDFMPVDPDDGKKLIRRLTTIRGEVKYRMACCPRFNYGKEKVTVKQVSPNELIFYAGEVNGGKGPDAAKVRLRSSVELQISGSDGMAEFTLAAGKTADFLLENADNEVNADDDLIGCRQRQSF